MLMTVVFEAVVIKVVKWVRVIEGNCFEGNMLLFLYMQLAVFCQGLLFPLCILLVAVR